MRVDATIVALLVCAAARPALCGTWFDCSASENITHPVLTFAAVTSSPDPVVHGVNQTITKTMQYSGLLPLPKVTARLEQYFKAFNRTWLRFLSIDTDFCHEHAPICPIAPHSTLKVTTHHPPLHWGTPYGWYRSKQTYLDATTGAKLGCVDMRFDYCKDAASCKYAAGATEGEHKQVALGDEHDANLAGGSSLSAPCCETCSWPRSKYYSVDAAHGFCGEACMLPALYPLFKRFEPNLTAASARDEHACAAQLTPRGEHYTEYTRTVTHGVPGLAITLDLYSGPKARVHVV